MYQYLTLNMSYNTQKKMENILRIFIRYVINHSE